MLLADAARLTIGAYRDRDEFHVHDDRITQVELLPKPREGPFWAKRLSGWSKLKPWTDTPFGWGVEQ